jgi:flagellar hook-length control protein FliK
MGPKLAVVTAPPPRNVPQQRADAGQPDGSAAEAFGSVLEEQANPATPSKTGPQEAIVLRHPSPLSPGFKLDAPIDAAKLPADGGASLPGAEAGWQALLAQVLSGETGKIVLPPQTVETSSESAGVAAAKSEMPDLEAGRELALPSLDVTPPGDVPVDMTALPPQAAEAAVAALLAAPGQPVQNGARKDAPSAKGEPPQARDGSAAKGMSIQGTAATQTPVAMPDDGQAAGNAALATGATDPVVAEESGKPLDGFARQMLSKTGDDEAVEETRSVAVRNVNTTTHYPVVSEPMRQIAGQVVREVQAATAPVAAEMHKPAAHDVSKTMDIQLEPEALGVVNVKMKLSGGALTIQIEVAKPETLDMIKRSQDVLHRSLQGENCQLDGLTIRAASAADAGGLSQNGQSAQQQSGQSNQNGASNNSASAQQQDASSHAEDRSRGQRGHERASGKSEYDETVTPRDRASVASGIYL